MRKLLLWMLQVIRAPKRLYKRSMFLRQARLTDKRSTLIGPDAFCQNRSGNPDHIVIGHHSEILARICASTPNAVIEIGNYTTIRGQTMIGAAEHISIGNHVIISNHVTIFDNNNHPTDPELRMQMCESGFYSSLWNWEHSAHKPVVIEDNVWIGEHATVLKGVTVGKGSVIASHAVVTHDVEPYTVWAGNPARKVKELPRPS